ncbi:putative enterotoxin [Ophiocordyceps unilateralis]|uniref:Enterotoxin n=1 Tax=Ophiocordyceps unilateralis TaxID=268505 RepID=A0A2A9PNF5_OPHUN|nr:putative enterotoxin [Ophiocordyceps unilateralis]
MKSWSWTSWALAASSLTLRWPSQSQAAPQEKDIPTILTPASYVTPADEPQVLYFLCGANPRPDRLRSAGGLVPRLPNPTPDEVWGYATVTSQGSAWAQLWRDWRHPLAITTNWNSQSALHLYEVSTCPNMVAHFHRSHLNQAYWALGGFLWSQVRRYAAINPGDDVDNPNWIENIDFDPRWNRFHTSGWQPELSGYSTSHPVWFDRDWRSRRPAPAMTRREQALLFIRGIMQNSLLRGLFEWNGHLPLIRVRDPAWATPLARFERQAPLQNFQLDTLKVPEDVVQEYREKGSLSEEGCRVISLAISLSVWMHAALPRRGSHRRRSAELAAGDSPYEYCLLTNNTSQCDAVSQTDGTDCDALTNAIGQLNVASTYSEPYGSSGLPKTACSHLGRLIFMVNIADELYAGTYDEITARVGPSWSFEVAKEPHTLSRGESRQVELGMMKVFPSQTVALNEIDRISISARRVNAFGGDWWKIKGVQLQGQCSDSLTTIHLESFASINLGVKNEGRWRQRTEVWAGPVGPEDWDVTSYCTHFESLEFDVELGNGIGGGTYDDILIQIGRQQLSVMEQPWAGEEKKMQVNLNEAFGAKLVPVDKLIKFSIFSFPDGRGLGDWWELGGVSFEARCQRSGKRYRVDKYSKLDVWRLRDVGYKDHFDGKITLRDWKESSKTVANYEVVRISDYM